MEHQGLGGEEAVGSRGLWGPRWEGEASYQEAAFISVPIPLALLHDEMLARGGRSSSEDPSGHPTVSFRWQLQLCCQAAC